MKIRNPIYNAFGTIDCEVLSVNGQWGPYTASPEDVEAYGREVYALAAQMDIAPYVEPEPAPPMIPTSISRFQARAALLAAGLLDDVEAAVAAAGNFERLAWAEAMEWRRDSPTLMTLAAGVGLSEVEIDDLFVQAAQIRA